MDNSTGNLYTQEELERRYKKQIPKHFQKVDEKNLTEKAIKRRKVGRNEFCPCKSGKKFKKCRLTKLS